MKIVQLDFDDLNNPFAGGQARVTYEINRRLAKKHQITVVTGRYKGSKDEVIDGINYLRVGKEKFPWNFISYIYWAPRLIRTIPHDIVIESFVPPISTMLTPFFTEKPVIGIVHWFFAKEMSQKYLLPFVIWERIGIRIYRNFIVLNQKWAGSLRKINKKSHILITSFPSNGPKKAPEFQEKDYLLFLGRIDIHQKGLDLLIKSFEGVQGPDISLVIAGSGRDERKLKRLIRKSPKKNRINFLGRAEGKKKIDLLTKAKLVVVPSRYEMGPLVAKEAMAFGKPLIAFNITGLDESVLSEAAIRVKPFDTEAFSQAIDNLLKDQKKRKEMGRYGRKLFEKTDSWGEAAAKIECFLEKIIKNENQA